VVNSFEENDCENANTHAHGDVHLVVLAHLRRRCSFIGRVRFGTQGEIQRFRGSAMHIFHYTGGREFL
jgi:hypothetical protein